MKNHFIYILFFTLVLSCKAKYHDGVTKNIDKVDSLKNNLLGNWDGLGENDPVLEIKVDSIYYYQEKKAYLYKIINKDLVIYRAASKGILKNLAVVNDTMIFNDEQGMTIKAYKFK